jgi:hypothetical protein
MQDENADVWPIYLIGNINMGACSAKLGKNSEADLL